jgi:hypothetical protein
MAGGLNGSGSMSSTQQFFYSSETIGSTFSFLSVAASYSTGLNSYTTGYVVGGLKSDLTNSTYIHQLVFSTGTGSTLSSTTGHGRLGTADLSFSSAGYALGGFQATYLNSAWKFNYSTGTGADISATMAAVRDFGAGANSTTLGYHMCGNNSAGSATASTYKLIQATETISTTTATSQTCATPQGVNSSIRAYISGGNNGSTYYKSVRVVYFDTDNVGTLAAVLTSNKSSGAGFQSSTKGYFVAGLSASSTYGAGQEALTFSTEATSAATLSNMTSRSRCASIQQSTLL